MSMISIEPEETVAASLQSALLLEPIGLITALAAARTYVMKIAPRQILWTGNRWSVTLRGPFDIAGLWIGPAATSGNAVNFSAATAVTFDDGTAAKTVTDDGDYTSDTITFDHEPGKALILAAEVNSGSQLAFSYDPEQDEISSFWLAASEGASLDKSSGYQPEKGICYLIRELQALGV